MVGYCQNMSLQCSVDLQSFTASSPGSSQDWWSDRPWVTITNMHTADNMSVVMHIISYICDSSAYYFSMHTDHAGS